ncbi:hypothetical protein ACNOYE_23400 [Nannocystaceae bacterium ST9]
MSGLVRTTSLSLVCLFAAACHRDGAPIPETPDGSKPIAEVEGGGAELSIVAVPQVSAGDPYNWLFEPGGRRIASAELGECTIWDVESGRTLRSLPLDPVPQPCAEWLPPLGVYEFVRNAGSADGKLDIAGTDIVDAESGNTLRSLACRTCADADMYTWSASGHQLAFFWIESRRLEIWDADSGKKLRSETLPGSAEIEDSMLTWPAVGPLLLTVSLGDPVDCDEDMGLDCDYDEEGNPLPHQASERRGWLAAGKDLVELELGINQGTVDELSLDPEGRWLFWTYSWEERRDGTSTIVEFIGLDDRPSGMSGEHTESYGEYEGSMTREGQWRIDGATHWAVTIIADGYEGGLEAIGWETTLTQPALGRRWGEVADDPGWEAEVEVELFGFVDGALRFGGQLCERESCKPLGPELPPDCLMLDIGSNHGSELLDCGGRVHLRSRAGLSLLPLDAGSAFWWWSRGGALVIEDGATFMVLDAASGKVGLQRSDIGEVYDGKLGPELDRLVLVGEQGVEVLDLTKLAVIWKQPDDALEFAFSPTGDRLALLDAEGIRVIELASGKQTAAWEAPVEQLAFRQDGAVIYVGGDYPVAGFDVASGEPVNDPLLFAKILEAVDQGGEIDPSWRWIMHDEFGELLRTVDGRTIEWLDEGAWLPDSGQYGGKGPGLELAFRVGDDAWGVPEFDAQQLAKWLQIGDLEQVFLSGQAIAKPKITAGELQGLRAKVQGKGKTP